MKARRTLSSVFIAVIAALSLAACSADPTPTSVPTPTSSPTATPSESPTATPTPLPVVDIMVIKGQPFNMGLKHRAFVNAEGYTIDYVGVVSDSRCARDVVCVTAGRAVVEFSITPGTGEPTESYRFGIGDGGLEPSNHDIGGLRVSLVGLEPQPHSDGRSLAYRAILVVTVVES